MTSSRTSLPALAFVAALTACAQAPAPPVAPPAVQVFVTPNVETLQPGETATFSATVSGTSQGAVAWSATCGQVTTTGPAQVAYTAPDVPTGCTLTATSVAHPEASGSASITVAFDIPEVAAATDGDSPVAEIDLAPGETILFRVTIPSNQRGPNQRLVVEADDDEGFRQLDLVLLEPDGTTATASTSGTAFFRPGRSGIGDGFIGAALGAARAATAERQSDRVDRSVAVVGNCFGPCIARPAPAGLTHVYVELTNAGTTTETVPFFAYTQGFIDEEPADAPAQAVSIGVGDSHRGAIEILGDEDWVEFTAAGTVFLDERDGFDVNLAMDIYDGTTLVDTIRAGESAPVFPGEYAVLYSESPVRASVYGFYIVSLE